MSEPAGLMYLSQSVLEGLGLTTADVIESIEHLLRGRAAGKVWNSAVATINFDGRVKLGTVGEPYPEIGRPDVEVPRGRVGDAYIAVSSHRQRRSAASGARPARRIADKLSVMAAS